MFSLFVTDEIHLELLDLMHATALFRLSQQNREFLRQWLPWPDFIKQLKDTEKFIASTKLQWANGNGFQCAIFYRQQLCGIIGFHDFNRTNETASIGYWLAEQQQGKGIVSQSLNVLIDAAFNTYGIGQIIIRCATGNQSSRKIPERLGFEMDGVLPANEKLNGHYVDHAVYRLLKTPEAK